MQKLKCGNCPYFTKINDEKRGVCTLPESYFPTSREECCHYMASTSLFCADCDRYGNDTACMTALPSDPADNCSGFIDKLKFDVMNAFFVWSQRGIYDREFVNKLCDEFENSKEYQLLQNIRQISEKQGE